MKVKKEREKKLHTVAVSWLFCSLSHVSNLAKYNYIVPFNLSLGKKRPWWKTRHRKRFNSFFKVMLFITCL